MFDASTGWQRLEVVKMHLLTNPLIWFLYAYVDYIMRGELSEATLAGFARPSGRARRVPVNRG